MTAASDKMHVLAAPRRNPFADFATPEAIGTEHRLGMSISDAVEVVRVGRDLTADAWTLAEARANNIVNGKAA